MFKKYEIDLYNEEFSRGYIKEEGKDLTFHSRTITTESEYIIIFTSNVELINQYISDNTKRYYVLLDVDSKFKNKDSSNITWIPTDMKLPNLIVSKDFIYSITFCIFSYKRNLIDSFILFAKSKIIEYSRKYLQKIINEYLFFFGDDQVSKYTKSDLSSKYEVVISNQMELKQTYNTRNQRKGNDLLLFEYYDYSTIIEKGEIRLLFKDNNDYYVLNTDMELSIDDYTRYKYFKQKDYKSLFFRKIYDDNLNEVQFEEVVNKTIELKVDLLTRNSESKLKDKIDKEIIKINKNGILAKKISIKTNISTLHFNEVYKPNNQKEIDISENEELLSVLKNGEKAYEINKKRILVSDKYRTEYADLKFDEILLF